MCSSGFLLPLTITQLLFDFIKHTVAHFTPSLVHFLFCRPFYVKKNTKIC